MKDNRRSEGAFETVIEEHLLANGYSRVKGAGFDRERAIFPETVLAFIRDTQPREWGRLEKLHGASTGEQILSDLCKWMDAHGSLSTLRHGFKCYGRPLRVAFFKAAHTLNPELEDRYAANVLGVTRQLHYSPRSKTKSLDVVISVNGVPVATVELKNPFTRQTVDDAMSQYRNERDPAEPIFAFKRRALVHFAVDTELVRMTTRLAGRATDFLPFDKGDDGAAGNPLCPRGSRYRTAYLWEEVFERHSLLDILARFVHLQSVIKRDERGRKATSETMVFPRFHQLGAVRLLEAAARDEGTGTNYLIEHSAGSGKSNTIGWLAHRLSSLHDNSDQHIAEDEDFDWVSVESRHTLTKGMFVAQVVGKSMEPFVPDGSWCLFRSPVEGTREGKTVLVQLRDSVDPETGQRYTVKRYESRKVSSGDSWRHTHITLKPTNSDFEPIVFDKADEVNVQVIAELIEVLPPTP